MADDRPTYQERIEPSNGYRKFSMESYVPVKGQRGHGLPLKGKYYSATVDGIMPAAQYYDWRKPQVTADRTGQRPLFAYEYNQPPVITGAFSHSNPASRAMIPIMLARFDQERRKHGMPPVESTTDLSVHSSRLAKKGVESGLIAPEGEFKRSRGRIVDPEDADDDANPNYDPTNDYEFEDAAHEKEDFDIERKRSVFGFTPLHAAEVAGTKEHLRSMLGRRPPKPKNLGAQFEQLALDVPKVPLKFVGDD